MLVTTEALDETDPVTAPAGLANGYGVPCAFAGCSAHYHPARGTTGVVLCAPWGFEDLVMRKSWRLLAEAIAKVGYPCLRFDYPGTGDSLGVATAPTCVADWSGAIGAGADLVRRIAGVKRFVFVGQSLGAALAVEAARGRGDVIGLHLIAPVVKGRAYVRELAATATIVADRLRIAADGSGDGSLSVVGFPLSAPMVESIKTLDATRVEALCVEHVVVYDQADRKAAAEAVEHFRRLGARADLEPVEPYHVMVSDATVIQPLPVAIDRLVAALQVRHPVAATLAPMALPQLQSAILGDTFREDPIRFGGDRSLFGVLCRRIGSPADAPAVVLLNRGLNPHVGWRRVSVDQARGLADAGITSLRIDVAGLGESRDAADRPQNLIYSDRLLPDIAAAVDVLVARGHTRIILAGVCSGGYTALAAAHADPRVAAVVAVNTQRFLWNPKESFEDVIRFGLRSVDDYVGDLKGKGTLRKLVRSRRRIVPAMRFLAQRYFRNAMARVPLRLRSRILRGSMEARIARFFATFAARQTRVSLVYSAGDPGLVELRNYFGPGGRDMPHANVSVAIVPDADHNLTTAAATRWMIDHTIAVASEGIPREPPRPVPRAARVPNRAVCPT